MSDAGGWSGPFRAAYLKGYQAAREGRDRGVCPYDDNRTDAGRVTFSRAFLKAWVEGWEAGKKDQDTPVSQA